MPDPTPPDPAVEAAVARLVGCYCVAVDDGRWDDPEALFLPAARFAVMGMLHEGPAAVRQFLEAALPESARGRHVVGRPLLLADGDGAALGWVDYQFFDSSGAVTNMGRYHDRYVLDDDGRWRYEFHEIVFRGEEPAHTDPPPLRDIAG